MVPLTKCLIFWVSLQTEIFDSKGIGYVDDAVLPLLGAMEEWKSEDGTRTRNDSHAGVEHTYTPDDSDLLESSSDGGSSANSYHEDIPDPVELDHPLPVSTNTTTIIEGFVKSSP